MARLVLLSLLLTIACAGPGAPAAPTAASKPVAASPSSPLTPRARCDTSEQLAVHSHVHLTVLDAGRQLALTANVGIRSGCLYWLHTHDQSGIIHIEAPVSQADTGFTLGDFFDVWGQPLDSGHVANVALTPAQKLVIFLDGQPFPGEPRSVPLHAHAQIGLEITPPLVDPPPVYSFPPNY